MPRQSFAKKPPVWLGVTLLILATALICFWGYKKWVSYEHQMADRALQEKQNQEALPHIKRLKFLQPTSRDNSLLYAKATMKDDPEAALAALEPLIEDPQSTQFKESSLTYLELCLDLNRLEQANQIIEKMAPSMSGETSFMLLRVRYHTQSGDLVSAIDELGLVLNIDPNNADAQFTRAQILLMQSRVINWIEAKSALKEASRSKAKVGLLALEMLSSRPEIKLFPEERKWLIEELNNHPHSTIHSRLLAATQMILLGETAPESIITQTIATEAQQNPLAVGKWLLDINQPKHADAILSQYDIPESKELWELQYYTALQNQDFNKLKDLLAAEHSSASKPQTATFELYFQLRDTRTLSKQDWQNTFNLTLEAEEADSMMILARMAGGQGWWNLSNQAYENAIALASNPLLAANLKREQFTVALHLNDTSKALKISKDLREAFPNNPTYINNYFYFNNLLGNKDADQLATLIELQENLEAPELNATIAFVLYLSGDYQAAEQRLAGVPSWLRSQPDVTLLNALIEIKLGNKEIAQSMLTSIKPEALLPEEKQLRDEALAALAL
ncbi:tetratricopeptide repeat protein [Cerasicoccus frondis]|uniref:tetratricopeptide repeat protein n=1 Tax=Cerasicoccus frondis TaxID=490090 RepID=UPI0028528A97|nr:hypothetical protein [Cerasicoccus frondis]